MVRRVPWCLALLAIALPARAQQPAATTPPPPVPSKEAQDKARLAEMTSLIALGDRERRSGRLAEATTAYSKAVQLGDNPLVGGRLGLLLVHFGDYVLGADYLLDALDRANNATPSERLQFLKGFDIARAQVCRVTVEVTEAHAKILLDGNVTQEDGANEFTMFVALGAHELRAQRKGFDDAHVNLLAEKGSALRVKLVLEPAAAPAEDVLQVILRPPRKTRKPGQVSHIIDQWGPDPSTRLASEEPKQDEKRGPRFSVNGGVVTVLGVASWNPAVGGVIGVGLRAHEYVSIGLEGRAAWLATDVADRPISAMTAGGVLSACGHLKWLYGCGLGYVGTVSVTFSSERFSGKSYADVVPGLGGRAGAEFRLASSFLIRGGIDVVGTSRGVRVFVGQQIVADQPPLLISMQVTGGWEF